MRLEPQTIHLLNHDLYCRVKWMNTWITLFKHSQLIRTLKHRSCNIISQKIIRNCRDVCCPWSILYCWCKVSKFFNAALFSNMRTVDVRGCTVSLKTGPFWDLNTETYVLTFLKNKKLFARTIYIRLLIKIYHKSFVWTKKWKKWIFQFLPLNALYISVSWVSVLIIIIAMQ